MRRYAYLKEPIKTNKKDYIYKIMLYQTKKDGVYLFMYCQKDAVQCSFDYWYKTVLPARCFFTDKSKGA